MLYFLGVIFVIRTLRAQYFFKAFLTFIRQNVKIYEMNVIIFNLRKHFSKGSERVAASQKIIGQRYEDH